MSQDEMQRMLRAGFAKVDITPGRDVNLIGYAFRYEQFQPGNAGVHDPLFARALAIDDGSGQPAALVSLDLATLETGVARRLRQAVATKLDTSLDRVIVCCTHTHSGPFPVLDDAGNSDEALKEDAVEGGTRAPDKAYFALLQQHVEEAAAMANGKTFPVELCVNEAPLGLGYDRRVVQDDGTVAYCWSPEEQEHLYPQLPQDPTCTVAILRQVRGQRRYVVFNIGAHSLVLGKTSRVVSADWPGAACGVIEDLIPGAQAMFTFGACGDVHPWIATQEDPACIRTIATAAGGFAAVLTHGARPLPHDALLRTASTTVTIGQCELDLVAWRLAGLLVLCAPVELFTGLSAMLRERIAAPLLLITEANGRSGYWPTRDAFAQGGYEVDIAKHYGLKSGDGEVLVDHLAALAAKV